jgi:uncharacterized membrane protein YkoI
MKNSLMILTFGFIAFIADAQKKNDAIPAAVKQSFAKRFPNVQGVKWSEESETEFEAEFKNKGKEQSANFDQTGKWLETEWEVKKSELPAAVQATITKEFAGYKVEETELTETPDGTFYEVEVEKGELTYEAQISREGKLIKKEEKKEEGKEKKEKKG